MKKIILAASICIILFMFSFSAGAAELKAPEIIDITVTDTTVTIDWGKIKGADGYEVFRDNDEGKPVCVATVKETCCTVEELSADSVYEFLIRAYKKGDSKKKIYSDYSESSSVKTKLERPVASFLSATTDSITVTWNKIEGAQTYKVMYGISGKDGYESAGETEDNSLKIEGLNGKNRYKIKVIAKGEENSSPYSELVRLCTVPEKVEEIRVSSKDGGSLTLEWDQTTRANAYYVYVSSAADGKYKKVATVEGTAYTYKKKTPKKAYYFKVAPVITNKLQITRGELSKAKKATIGNITIEAPEVVARGDQPLIKVPYYNSKVKWKTSDKSVIKIKDTKFYAVGEGTVTLTAVYENKYKAKIKIKVTAPTLRYMSAVYDVTNNQYIFANRINERCYPASITKLITALVVLKYMDEDDIIVVGDELNMVEAMSSRCDILRGEKFRLKDILYGLLLPSGGDAAYTVAVNCARKVAGDPDMGYVAAKNYFVGLMNKYMKSIGATGTHCVNPHGYPVDGHYSTVHDLVLVARRVLKNDTLRQITSTSYKYVTSLTGQGHSWGTTNSLIASYAYYYSPYSHGMKTGTVNDNYTGIISAATKDDRTIITVVIGCESYNARYDATHKLYRTYLY